MKMNKTKIKFIKVNSFNQLYKVNVVKQRLSYSSLEMRYSCSQMHRSANVSVLVSSFTSTILKKEIPFNKTKIICDAMANIHIKLHNRNNYNNNNKNNNNTISKRIKLKLKTINLMNCQQIVAMNLCYNYLILLMI